MIRKNKLKKLNENEISNVAGGIILDNINLGIDDINYCVVDDENKLVKGWFSSRKDAENFANMKGFSTRTASEKELDEIESNFLKEYENKWYYR